jgi:hypothetical protein
MRPTKEQKRLNSLLHEEGDQLTCGNGCLAIQVSPLYTYVILFTGRSAHIEFAPSDPGAYAVYVILKSLDNAK